FKTYMETFADSVPFYASLDDSKFEILPEASEAIAWDTTRAVLGKWRELVAAHPRENFTETEFLQLQDGVKAATGAKGKNLFMAIRVAVIGKPHGTELKLLVPLMAKTSLLKRADQVLKKLG
ncbi:MAG: glutamate--tRNA ligase, partial [Bdellovibrionales bacterium]